MNPSFSCLTAARLLALCCLLALPVGRLRAADTALIQQGDTAYLCGNSPLTLSVNSPMGTTQKWFDPSANLVLNSFSQVGSHYGNNLEGYGRNMLVVDGVPHVGLVNQQNSGTISIKRYDGSIWSDLGLPGLGIGATTANDVVLAEDNGDLYAAFIHTSDSSRVAVRKWNGTSWVTVGNSLAWSRFGSQVRMVAENGTIHVAYHSGWPSYTLSVAKFNGSSWSSVGTSTTGGGARYISMAVDNGVPYVGYRINLIQQARVIKYNGSAWVAVGGSIATSSSFTYSDLVINNGTPYFAGNIGTGGNMGVIKYDGSSWGAVGNFPLSTGGYSKWPSFIQSNGVLYLSYSTSTPGTEIRVKRFDGTNWTDPFSGGLPTGTVTKSCLAADGNQIYVSLVDVSLGSRNKLYVMDAPAPPTLGTNNTFTVTSPGSYGVEVTNDSCIGYDTILVMQSSAINLSASSTPENGVGNNGTVTATASGGLAPYSYLWSNGQSGANLSSLVANTYSVTVTDARGCTATQSTTVAAVNVIGQPEVAAAQCGTTLPSMSDYIYYSAVAGASNYRYRLIGGGLNTVYERGNAVTNLRLVTLPGIAYGTTYSLEVAAHVNGTWGAYGAACQISTPANAPTTQLNSNQCGTTLTNLSQWLYIQAVPGATNYRYRVTAAGFNHVYTRGHQWTNFRMNFVPGLAYNTTYNVQVAAFVNGSWGAYGPSCAITTPINVPLTQMVSSQCNITLSSWQQYLFYQTVPGADNYRVEITNAGLGFSTVYVRGYQWTTWRFDWASSNFQPNTTYNVRVAASINGSWGNYGPVCTITTPATAQPRLFVAESNSTAASAAQEPAITLFPNPSKGTFFLLGSWDANETVNVQLFDLSGKLILEKGLAPAGINATLEVNTSDLPAGMYLIRVASQEHQIIQKLLLEQ